MSKDKNTRPKSGKTPALKTAKEKKEAKRLKKEKQNPFSAL